MNKPSDLKLATVPVWINGKAVVPQGRMGEVYNPATGQVTKRVPYCDAEVIDAAVKAAAAALPGLARRLDPAPRARDAEAFWLCCKQHQKEIAALITAGARQDAARRDGLGAARHRGGRVRLRHPAAAEGRVLRERRHRGGHAHACASRSACAPASRRSIFRRWCRCGCSRWRSPAATPSSSSPRRKCRRPRSGWPSCSRRPGCPTACSTSCTATRRRSTRS